MTKAFEHIRTQAAPTLNLSVEEYRHRGTGARHFHLSADDDNNAFLVAFLTVPEDDTGVAHILEHTSLCGSERYPVRDPFFMMTRRSLNTFMNAFTSSDWTAYPFASQNRKDFNNLLDVYLDSVFFPRLDPLDFAQEGHRLEFADPADADSELVFKGVVFNEMKGAMSSPVRRLWQTLQSALFPTITYHHNSGGEPAAIPDLSYAQLKQFHARHYHPGNAVFMTYGDIPAQEHQRRFQEQALDRFSAKPVHFHVPMEQRLTEPQRIDSVYALDGEEDASGKTHIVMGSLLGPNTDSFQVMETHLLGNVLLDNSASPLRHALEVTELAGAPSELCGVDDATHEMIFVCGVEGSEPENAQRIEDLILGVLREVADNGVDPALVESVLHQMELHQREVGGGGFPYGLQLMVNALNPAVHGADPVETLNIDDALDRLRRSIADPGYIKGLAKRLLLDNPHRVRLTLKPDTDLSQRERQAEDERLAEIKAGLDARERQRIRDRAEALEARQMQQDDPEQLPKVTLEDVPLELKIAVGETVELAGAPVVRYAQGTNGLVYAQVVSELPDLEEPLRNLLPLYTDFVTEVGVGGLDYRQTQAWQAAVTGGLSCRTSIRAPVDHSQGTDGFLAFGGKALARNAEALAELMVKTFRDTRFDERARLKELVAQTRAHRWASITDQGHGLAMTAAGARIAPLNALRHQWSGLAGLQALKSLDERLADPQALQDFSDHLTALRDCLIQTPHRFALVAEEEALPQLTQALERRWIGGAGAANAAPFQAPETAAGLTREAWATSTQVNFAAKAYATVPWSHADAPALSVLGGFLRNGHLHRAIREQGGAYGAGASWDPDTGTFRFYSYRDPRLDETLTDFDASVEWLLQGRQQYRELEEAILGVIAAIDRPDSPAGEALGAYFSQLHGRTPERRRDFRARILRVTSDDLRRVAQTYLDPEHAHIAVVSHAQMLDREGKGLERITL